MRDLGVVLADSAVASVDSIGGPSFAPVEDNKDCIGNFYTEDDGDVEAPLPLAVNDFSHEHAGCETEAHLGCGNGREADADDRADDAS
jgi:hypothetical protein